VRLRFADSDFSNAVRIAVDLPLNVSWIACNGVRDSVNWKTDEITVTEDGHLSCWVTGLPENADRNNVHVLLGGIPLRVTWVGAADARGGSQVNATVPGSTPKGEHALRVECGGIRSEPYTVRVV
jgi:uncharacterized protein (TIGR03437 family)